MVRFPSGFASASATVAVDVNPGIVIIANAELLSGDTMNALFFPALVSWRSSEHLRIESMAFLSLACSVSLFLTGWTMLSFFIFGPLGIYLGWKSYQRSRARARPFGIGRRLVALTPLFIAIAIL
jgi:hypothetical protein